MKQSRFCIDETSFDLRADSNDIESAAALLHKLLNTIERCRRDGEAVVRWSGLDLVHVIRLTDGADVDLCTLMYHKGALDPDLQQALQQIINLCPSWDGMDETEIDDDICIDGLSTYAPSVAWAHQQSDAQHAVACLCLRVGSQGVHTVSHNHRQRAIFFLAGQEQALLEFYRSVFEVEDLDRKQYLQHATLAFPALYLLPDLEQQWNAFDGPYRELRPKVTQHLAVLNDHFLEVFNRNGRDNDKTAKVLKSEFGIDLSSESSNTHANKQARAEREVTVQKIKLRCDWHCKLAWNKNRIHFHPGHPQVASGRIVVAIFHRHLST